MERARWTSGQSPYYQYKPFRKEHTIDSSNDAFVPQLEGDFVSMEMEIYNRWGKQVYTQSATKELSWDAAGLPDGVYYCAIEYRCVVNGRKKQGIHTSVTVVR